MIRHILMLDLSAESNKRFRYQMMFRNKFVMYTNIEQYRLVVITPGVIVELHQSNPKINALTICT